MRSSNFPKRLVVEMTSECNLSCSMCPRQHIDMNVGHITKELWEKVVDEVATVSPGTILIPFWRGESLLHKDFCELIEYALGKKVKIHISTNGHKLSKDRMDVLKRCEFVTFSIHSETGYENARRFLALREDNKPTAQASFVKGEKTSNSICKALIDSSDLGGFDSVRVYDEHTRDGIFGKADVTNRSDRQLCPKLDDTLVVDCEGHISRCNHIWVTDKSLDVNKASIQAIWKSSALKAIRTNYPDAYCKNCDQWIGSTLGESYRKVNGKIECVIHDSIGAANE